MKLSDILKLKDKITPEQWERARQIAEQREPKKRFAFPTAAKIGPKSVAPKPWMEIDDK